MAYDYIIVGAGRRVASLLTLERRSVDQSLFR